MVDEGGGNCRMHGWWLILKFFNSTTGSNTTTNPTPLSPPPPNSNSFKIKPLHNNNGNKLTSWLSTPLSWSTSCHARLSIFLFYFLANYSSWIFFSCSSSLSTYIFLISLWLLFLNPLYILFYFFYFFYFYLILFFHMNLYLFSSVESVLIEELNCSSAFSFVYAASSLIRS